MNLTRTAIEEHWRASEDGDTTEVEHAIYAVDAILDYPDSAIRRTFPRSHDDCCATWREPCRAPLYRATHLRQWQPVGERVHHHLRRRANLLSLHHGICCTRRSTSPTPSMHLRLGQHSLSRCRTGMIAAFESVGAGGDWLEKGLNSSALIFQH